MYISPKYERVELLSTDVITVSNGNESSGSTPTYKGTNCDVYEGAESVFGGSATSVAADINSILRG